MKGKGFTLGVMLLAVVAIIGQSAAAVAGSYDDAFRCGTDLVLLGDSSYRVRAKCGNPTAREYVGTNYHRGFPAGELRDVEEWIYNRGPTDFVYTLRFHGGTLTEIYRSGRGF